MSLHFMQDPITKRWSAYLPDEPGRPRIEADTPKELEQFWSDVLSGVIHREQAEKRKAQRACRVAV